MAEPRLRVGIISANWGVTAHLPAWRALADDVEVTAICTSREATARAAAAANGIPRPFWDYRAMCADPHIDVVDCGTRPSLRYDMVMAALSGGKHVYNGIPFAVDAPHARRMLDEQTRRRLVGAVDAYIQAVPAVAYMKALIDDGYIGELNFVTSHFNLQLFLKLAADFGWLWFADEANGASALRNLGSHLLHPIVHMFGPVAEVVGDGRIFLEQWHLSDGGVVRPKVLDTASALMRFERGGTAQVTASWAAADGPGWMLEACGSKGRLRASGPAFPSAATTTLLGAEGGASHVPLAAEMPVPERFHAVPGAKLSPRDSLTPVMPMAQVFAGVVAAIRGGGDAAPSFAQAVHVQEIVEAIQRSIERRAWERVEG